MKKKELGSSLRQGLVAGSLAGCIAGWGAFALHSQPAVAVTDPAPAPAPISIDLPAVPDPPSLGALPGVVTRQVTTNVAVPAFRPLPPLPVRPAAPRVTTRTS